MPGKQGQPGNCPLFLSRVFFGVMLELNERIGGEKDSGGKDLGA